MESWRAGHLVVQPRMGVADPADMGARLAAVAKLPFPAVGTITVDSYTRVGDVRGARRALRLEEPLNGFPLGAHLPEVVRDVVSSAAQAIPVQVRHGSADPTVVLRSVRASGLLASEGGPLSYCVPYSRMPLAEATARWADAVTEFAREDNRGRPHLESFGGCMLGQLCPPAMLVAISVLEGMFFEQKGMRSLSMSYAEQGHQGQDIAALQALHKLADDLLSDDTDWHVVHYMYMGVFPGTRQGAHSLIARSALTAAAGGAARIIVKTSAEAHRLPTLAENLRALDLASAAARLGSLAGLAVDDASEIYEDARNIIAATLELSDDIGGAIVRATRAGIIDIPFGLHPDLSQSVRSQVTDEGRVVWAATGRVPVRRAVAGRAPGASELHSMLHRVASHFDADSESAHILVVGCGPRGLSYLERLAVRLRLLGMNAPNLRVTIIDPYSPGGRIWRTDQPDELMMNTVCGEVTMFSGPAVHDEDHPGAGRTFAEWWAATSPGTYRGPNDFATRRHYGAYLAHVYEVVHSTLEEEDVVVEYVHGTVADVTRAEENPAEWTVTLGDGRRLCADQVVIATGHPRPRDAQGPEDGRSPRRLHGDSAADLQLEGIEPDDTVAVIGLGLSFYDVMARLTAGRGGKFVREGDAFSYIPSGREPRLIALSRSGLPLPARGHNQKPPTLSYRPILFTLAALGPHPGLDRLMALLLAEVHVTYYARHLDLHDDGLGNSLREMIAGSPEQFTHAESVRAAAAELCSSPLPEPLDLLELARPFVGQTFGSLEEWSTELRRLLEEDLREAALGNVDSPLKAALDTIRDIRGTLRYCLEFGRMAPRDRLLFDSSWAPVIGLLTAGPPAHRIDELLALMDCGLVEVLPPSPEVQDSPSGYLLSSAALPGTSWTAQHLIDARIPKTVLPEDQPGLLTTLIEREVARVWSATADGVTYQPGGLEVEKASLAVVSSSGRPAGSLHALGIPTEGCRWFTQVGSGRPGPWGDFFHDASKVADATVASAYSRSGRKAGLASRLSS